MNATTQFFDLYTRILIEVFFFITAILYAHWLRAFVIEKKAAFAAAALYWAINLVSRYVDGFPGFGKLLWLFALVIPYAAVYRLDGRRNPFQKMLLCIVFLLIRWLPVEIFSEIGFFERDFVLSRELFQSSVTAIVIEFVVWNLIFYGVSALFLYFSIRLLHRTYRRKNEELSWREFIMLLTPAGTLLVVRPIIYSYFELWMKGIENGSIKANIPGNIFRVVFCILSYVSIHVVIIFYQQIKDAKEEEYIRYSIDSQKREAREHIREIRLMYEKMRAMRHDLGNHMTIMMGLLESGEKDKASEYIEEWKAQFEEITPRIKTGNAITDVALSEYAERFEKAGIIFESNFLYPDDFGINEFDLCVILMNALQNAYEASVDLPDSRVVIVSCVRGSAFVLQVKNLVENKVCLDPGCELPRSSKEGEGHGYGLKNIRNIARKYNGDIEIKQEEREERGKWFVLNVMLVHHKLII